MRVPGWWGSRGSHWSRSATAVPLSDARQSAKSSAPPWFDTTIRPVGWWATEYSMPCSRAATSWGPASGRWASSSQLSLVMALPALITATWPERDGATWRWKRSSSSRKTSTSSVGSVPTTWRSTRWGLEASSCTVYQQVAESAAQANP